MVSKRVVGSLKTREGAIELDFGKGLEKRLPSNRDN